MESEETLHLTGNRDAVSKFINDFDVWHGTLWCFFDEAYASTRFSSSIAMVSEHNRPDEMSIA